MVNVPWCHDCNQPLGLCTCVVSVAEASDPLEDFRDYHHGVVAALNEALKKAEARALAAEAQRDKLRAGLEYAAMGLGRIHDSLLSNGPKQASGEMTAHFRDRARSTLNEIAP